MSLVGPLVLLVILGFPVAVIFAAPLVGMRRSQQGVPLVDQPVFAGLAALALIVGAVFLTGDDPDVTAGGMFKAALWAGVGAILIPGIAYYALGHFLSERPVVLGLVFAVLLVPAAYYLFIVLAFAVTDSSCAPDAYECPF